MTATARVIIALSSALSVACTPPAAGQRSESAWKPGTITEAVLLGRTTDRKLAEASGVARSRQRPGLLWVITDSGNPAELYGIDSTGALLQTVKLPVENNDWEETATGPCGSKDCIYIADTGDNSRRRREVQIHRLPEPGPRDSIAATVETLTFSYPDGRHDVEAMGVLPDGTVLLVTKGRSGRIISYTIGADAWYGQGSSVAESAGELPIQASLGAGRAVTGLAVSADGRQVAVRTYRDIFIFDRPPSGALIPGVVCDILGREPQGEGITFDKDGSLILISERGLFQSGTIQRMRCEKRTTSR